MKIGDLIKIYGPGENSNRIGIVLSIDGAQIECFWDTGDVLWCGLWVLEVIK